MTSLNLFPRYGLLEKILALGFLVLLSGMFWIGSRSNYHQAYYALFALPALITLFWPRYDARALLSNKSILIFVLLSGYMLISVTWSDTTSSYFSLVKRPLYIGLLFVGVFVLIRRDRPYFEKLLKLCIYVGALAAVYFIADHLFSPYGGRLTGHGALHNPLLTAHVFGMYAALSLAMLTSSEHPRTLTAAMLVVLVTLLIMTGSRTPIVGLVAATAWLTVAKGDRRTLLLTILLGSCLAILFTLKPDIVLSRGLSYRPEIWQQAWQQIAERPLFGYGFDNNARFFVAELNTPFHDPHNFFLGVLHAGGIIGLGLWVLLMATALLSAWRMRGDWLVLAASTALVFGLASSLTEGDSFLSRPKEHWFLIWIPFSILTATITTREREAKRST